VRVHENTASVFHLPLPPQPGESLSDEELDAVAGGGGFPSTIIEF
jgi:hypothetical protein